MFSHFCVPKMPLTKLIYDKIIEKFERNPLIIVITHTLNIFWILIYLFILLTSPILSTILTILSTISHESLNNSIFFINFPNSLNCSDDPLDHFPWSSQLFPTILSTIQSCFTHLKFLVSSQWILSAIMMHSLEVVNEIGSNFWDWIKVPYEKYSSVN